MMMMLVMILVVMIRVVGIGEDDDVSGYLCKDGKGCR